MNKTKPDRRLATIRNGVIAFVVLIVAGVGGYGLFRSTALDVGNEFVDGTHYHIIDGAPPVPKRGSIRVTEMFSYGCVHCRNFEPFVADWLRNAPQDVDFDHLPATFSPTFKLLAQAYYALESTNSLVQNHERLFTAIHDNGKQFLTPDMIADFVAGHGVSRDDFLRAFNSPATAHAITVAAQRERSSGATGVPSLMVADHYLVDMNSVPRKRAFDVVDFLVAKIRAERDATDADR